MFSKEGKGVTGLPLLLSEIPLPSPSGLRVGVKLRCPPQLFSGSADRDACCIMLSDTHPKSWGRRRRRTEKRTKHRSSFLTWRPQRLLLDRVEGGVLQTGFNLPGPLRVPRKVKVKAGRCQPLDPEKMGVPLGYPQPSGL